MESAMEEGSMGDVPGGSRDNLLPEQNSHSEEDNPVIPAPPVIAERVYLCDGIVRNRLLLPPCHQHKTEEEQKKQVHMYAVIGDQYTSFVDSHEWLRVHQHHDGAKMEIKSKPRRIEALAEYQDKLPPAPTFFYLCLYIIWLVAAVIFLIADLSERGIELAWLYGLLPIPASLPVPNYFAWRFYEIGAESREAHAILTQLFASFERIDSLELAFENESILDKALQTLSKKTIIDRLVVREKHEIQQKRTVELCRKHRIQHVFTTTKFFENFNDFKDFGQFVLDLVNLSVTTVDLYTSQIPDDDRLADIFTELSMKHISLQMATIHDELWGIADYPNGVQMHMRCTKNPNGSDSQEMLTVVRRGRGYHKPIIEE